MLEQLLCACHDLVISIQTGEQLSICNGIDEIIDYHLEVTDVGTTTPHYANKTSCKQLSKTPVRTLHVCRLLDEMLDRIEANWKLSKPEPRRDPSEQNWRWRKQLHVDPNTLSAEKSLEKIIVRVTGDDWVNQIPTASGLYDGHHDKSRNVDLAHRIKPGEFELIELKVQSDTPLFAAMESLKYAALFLFARLHYPPEVQAASELLCAGNIHWRVLAPARYFSGWNIGWLGQRIDEGISAYSKSRLDDLTMDFAFTSYPSESKWAGGGDQVLAALNAITNVDW